MKNRLIGLSLIILLSGFFATRSHTQSRTQTQSVMRLKLHQAQDVLEGISTENYPLIKSSAQKLSALSQSADWRLRQTVEYQKFTIDFNRQAIALEKAGDDKNLDAATLAYFQMTMSCVQCHKYLRGVREAKLDLEMPASKHTPPPSIPAGK